MAVSGTYMLKLVPLLKEQFSFYVYSGSEFTLLNASVFVFSCLSSQVFTYCFLKSLLFDDSFNLILMFRLFRYNSKKPFSSMLRQKSKNVVTTER